MNLSIVPQTVLALLWLLVIPCCAGAPFLRQTKLCTLGECLLAGYLFMFSLMEILALPLLMADAPLHILIWIYGALCIIMAILGIVSLFRNHAEIPEQIKNGILQASPWLWAAIAMIVIQVIIVIIYAHMDADDAFYIGTATTDVYTDTIFSINPYTGLAYSSRPSRYVLSPFPVFLAVISELSGGMSPAIMAHTVFPAVFIPFSYLVFHYIGKRWFRNDKRGQGIYLMLCALLTWFSGYSTYSSGNFQMVRIWQGKGFLAAAFLPLIFYLGLSIVLAKWNRYPWILWGMVNISCCLLSSMGILLAPISMALIVLLGIFQFRSLERTLKGLAGCLPSLILGIIYLVIR
ncbi:MAG: DUF6077 domain-containing protein [Clostridiales bacterium]|nr:DUF6077 domain-containing protein [Clostridiales bacterium]